MIDQRGLKSLRNFSAGMLLISILINVLLVIQHFGYKVNVISGITIKNSIQFFAITLVFTSIGSIFNKAKNLSQDTKDEIKLKMRLMLFGIVFFILYILFLVFIINDLYFIISGFIMLGIYINIIIITQKIIVLGMDDHQARWRAAVNGTDYNLEGSSIFWRWKLWVTPFEKVPFNKRSVGTGNIIMVIIFGYTLLQRRVAHILDVIFLLIVLRGCFSIIEYILGLYTSLTGTCTGIKEASRGDGHKRYWMVFVTDFKNKKEITFRTYSYPYFSEGDELKVVHGIISKQVILVNDRVIK